MDQAFRGSGMNRSIPSDLPGADLILRGLDDLACGRQTVTCLLVLVGRPRLLRLGFSVPGLPLCESPQIELFRALEREHGLRAYSQYNALLRRLIRFERAFAALRD